jgi:hypothetical protein
MKTNASKSVHITFTTRRKMRPPPIHKINGQLPQDIKQLGLHLDGRLTWHKHIFVKQKQLGHPHHKKELVTWTRVKTATNSYTKQYSNQSGLNGIQLWGTASTSNIEILEHFQSKALRTIVDAPWYVPNTVIRNDLHTPTVNEEICPYSSQYSAHLSTHPNDLSVNFMEKPDNRPL